MNEYRCIEEIVTSPLLRDKEWSEKVSRHKRAIFEEYFRILSTYDSYEAYDKQIKSLNSKYYNDKNGNILMHCIFFSDKIKEIMLYSLDEVMISTEMNSGTTDINDFSTIEIRDRRKDAEIKYLRIDKTKNEEVISNHKIVYSLCGKSIEAFYANNGIIVPSLSNGFGESDMEKLKKYITGTK